LIKAEAVRVEKRRRRTSRDVVAQKGEDINQNWQTKGDEKSSRAEMRLAW
jgi:hypothetical protein